MGEAIASAPTSPEPSAPRRDRRGAIWLAIVATLGFLPLNHCHFSGSDEIGVFEPARALYETGSTRPDTGTLSHHHSSRLRSWTGVD